MKEIIKWIARTAYAIKVVALIIRKYLVHIYIITTAIVIIMLQNGFVSFEDIVTKGNTIEYVAVAHAQKIEEPEIVLIEALPDWKDKKVVEEKIRDAFPEASSTMVKIAKCESNLVVDAYNAKSIDRGLFQINHTWNAKAKELGLDVTKPEDNIKFARWLYEKNGLADWRASSKCWR